MILDGARRVLTNKSSLGNLLLAQNATKAIWVIKHAVRFHESSFIEWAVALVAQLHVHDGVGHNLDVGRDAVLVKRFSLHRHKSIGKRFGALAANEAVAVVGLAVGLDAIRGDFFGALFALQRRHWECWARLD